MPYNTTGELPESVHNNLPIHAQEIYRSAFNHAWTEYEEAANRRGRESREEVAHKVAWAAVEKEYTKDAISGKWRIK